ncbi:protein LTV1 homolog isoform X2 [Juglans regia]|uniref:Protein LTV1 homolog isoform X1 n=2 Tax=Juglans regia TaxID=51240 RepID=A0A2I4DPJ5_JUGRE|nr:protein LTV1 homolog isoform X1 [Juglans regia]XP_018809067.2 protein LTV1 homolog isoform X2 [Juglans regia]
MGKKKKFIDRKKSATFQLLARDSSDPNYDNTPGGDRVFVRVDNNPVSFFADEDPTGVSGSGHNDDDPDSIFADAPEDNDENEEGDGRVPGNSVRAGKALPENVRRQILELGFPDDGYDYLIHLRDIKHAGGGSSFYNNPKARLDQLPRDVKAYDASRVQISEVDDDPDGRSIFGVASKTFGVRVQKAVDPDVAALLDDSDLSRFGSDVEDLEEDFVVRANLLEEEKDVEVDKRLNRVEQFGVTGKEVDKADNYDQQPTVDGLVFQSGIGNHLVEGGDEFADNKSRVRRLLDEQFDLLERQEYGTDNDDDDGDYDYVAEEDESLAKKLNQAIGDHLMDDLELDDKYKAPADLLRDNEISKRKELSDSAADVIRRCVEYAEKYENENDDKPVVFVEESSDESEVWDCETIVSTYSNLDNHPGKIGAPEIARRKKLAETVSRALGVTSHVISLRGKERLPVDFLPHSKKPAEEKVKDVGSNKAEQQKRKQLGQESKEEKKERKAAVKEERREARRAKKEMKELYRGEAQRAQKVAAIAGPSSIHLM